MDDSVLLQETRIHDQTRRSLEKILPAVREDEQSLFITLFSAIVLEKPDEALDLVGADEALPKI